MYLIAGKKFQTKAAILNYLRDVRNRNIDREVTGEDLEFMTSFFNSHHPDGPFTIERMYVRIDMQQKNYCFWIETPEEGLRDVSFMYSLNNIPAVSRRSKVTADPVSVSVLLDGICQENSKKAKPERPASKKAPQNKPRGLFDSLDAAAVMSAGGGVKIGRNELYTVLRLNGILDHDNLPIGEWDDPRYTEVQGVKKKINSFGGYTTFRSTLFTVEGLRRIFEEVLFRDEKFDPVMTVRMPFGKYKGEFMPVVLGDGGYCQWLMTQEWFNDAFNAKVFKIVSDRYSEEA